METEKLHRWVQLEYHGVLNPLVQKPEGPRQVHSKYRKVKRFNDKCVNTVL